MENLKDTIYIFFKTKSYYFYSCVIVVISLHLLKVGFVTSITFYAIHRFLKLGKYTKENVSTGKHYTLKLVNFYVRYAS